VHFAFSDQQTEFRDTVRQVLAKECTTGHLREAFARPTARGPRWGTLADLGVVGLSVPEAQGGLGLGLVDLVLLLEEAGRVALPEPLLETTALVAPLLAGLVGGAGSGRSEPGDEVRPPWDPAAGWSEAIAAGRVAAAVATPSTTAMSFPRRPAGVAGADGADLFVLALEGTAPGAAPELHVVDAGAVTVEPISSLDPTRRLGIPHWRPTAGTRVLSGSAATAAIRHIADRAAVAAGAELLGLSERMIAMAAEYAKERRQFGKPIGSFQAVKHLLAGAQVRLEFARPVVYGAAWALDHATPEASRSASVAKAYASESALEAARVSLQVHGAIGYTWECDLHLFQKRAWALAEVWGSAADHRALVLESLLPET
jgi:alkylation response protein AidB-like acyl-CoA dehydrogenase